MDIRIEDQRLGEICASESHLMNHFGKHNGKHINRRLCTLHATPSVADISQDPPDSLKLHATDSFYEFVIGHVDYGLVYFTPLGRDTTSPPPPEHFSQINKIKITRIEGGT